MRKMAGTLAALAVALAGTGCQMTTRAPANQPHIADLPPVPDRMRLFYQELRGGPFEILADLEQPDQAQIFRVEGQGRANLTVQRNRLATGAGALEVRLEDPAATLVIDDRNASQWAVPHDWHRYALFMASIYVAAPAGISLEIRSGTDQPAAWDSPLLPLRAGWNLVRIDLADVGRQVTLSDVRQIRLKAGSNTWPLTCYLDDLILADNTLVVSGDPEGEAGSLYVLKQGRRIHVGAVKQFELIFARGVLSGWYDLSSDPGRTTDLAGPGPAGPVLTALDESGSPLGGGIDSWTGPGRGVQTRMRILEAGSLAVTIQGTIRFGTGTADEVDSQDPDSAGLAPPTAGAKPLDSPAASQPADGPVEHRYLYTIRRDGRIFFDIQARVTTADFRPAGIGLAMTSLPALLVARQVDPVDRSLLDESGRPAAARGPANIPPPAVEPAQAMGSATAQLPIPRGLLLVRGRATGASLLLVPSSVAPYERVVSAAQQAGDAGRHMYVMGGMPSDTVHLAAMVAVWPPDLRDLPTAAAVARDYQEPLPPTVEVGRLRTDADGDLDGDGFAEGLGRWVVEPDGQVLRLRWPAGRLRFWPMLEVVGIGNKACWPYLDGRIIKPVEKRSGGGSIFAVPEILSRSTLLEVTVEK